MGCIYDDLTNYELVQREIRKSLVDLLGFLQNSADAADPDCWKTDLLPVGASVLLLIDQATKALTQARLCRATTAIDQCRMLLTSLEFTE